jgi:hypothetical protein
MIWKMNMLLPRSACIVLFGGKKIKVKSLTLKLIDKITMEEIYWGVFRTYTVTNNEMPTWIVHGFIVTKKRSSYQLGKGN